MATVDTQDRWVNTDRGQLFTRSWDPTTATAPRAPLILQHDSLGCIALWRDFPAQLAIATGHPVVAYDRLGFGRSDPHPSHLGVNLVDEAVRRDLPFVLDALEITQFIAFGHSIGGAMSIACAAVYPEACIALMTESAQVFAEPHTLEGIRQAKISFAQPGQLDRLKKYHGDKAVWVLDAWIETWLSPRFADWDLSVYLRDVRCPVLSLHGDQDEYGSLEHPRRIGALTGATCVTMEGGGHVPHREKPEWVTQTIDDWLQRNVPRRQTPQRVFTR